MNDQDKINRAKYAEELKNNPLLAEAFTALKAGYFEKLTKVKKRFRYERELKQIHESMQNLIRLENYIDRCIAEARVVEEKAKRKALDI